MVDAITLTLICEIKYTDHLNENWKIRFKLCMIFFFFLPFHEIKRDDKNKAQKGNAVIWSKQITKQKQV